MQIPLFNTFKSEAKVNMQQSKGFPHDQDTSCTQSPKTKEPETRSDDEIRAALRVKGEQTVKVSQRANMMERF